MSKILYIVESSIIGAKELAAAADYLGWEPIFLLDVANQEGDALTNIVQHKYVHCDSTSATDMAAIIKGFGLDSAVGVVTLLDSRVTAVSELAKNLSLPGIDFSALKLKSKAYVQQLLPEFSPKTIHVDPQQLSESQLANFLADCNGQVCVKPDKAAGGKGFFYADSVETIKNGILHAFKTLPSKLGTNLFLIQENIHGHLMSVEGYVLNGVITVITYSGRRKVGYTETIDLIPYSHYVKPELLDKCNLAIGQLIERSGFQLGFFHSEFLVNDQTILLIDANMGRLGGGNISEVIADVYGLGVIDYYVNYLSIMLNNKVHIDPSVWCNPLRNSIGISYGVAESCRVFDVQVPSCLQPRHTLAINRGHHISAIGESNWSILATVYGHEPWLLDEVDSISINSDKGDLRPVFFNSDKQLITDHLMSKIHHEAA